MKGPRLCPRKRIFKLLILTSPFCIDAIVIPPSRWGHVSVLCGNQLYVHGGHTGVNPMTAPIGSDLYSLDISAAFNSFSVPWVQLTPGPYAAFHSASLLGPGNTLLGIYGGNTSFSSASSGTNSLNLYNTATGTWAASPLQDPPRREQQAAASRLSDGTMFIYGGMVLSTDLLAESATTDMWTLGGYISSNNNNTGINTNSTSSTNSTTNITTTVVPQSIPTGLSLGTAGWQQLASPQVVSPADRSYHTVTLVRSNGLLVIIGGVSAGALVPMSEILVYDTSAGTWSVQTATGATPPLRRNHVAVANSNGQIYIHGGTDLGATTFFADVAILDTTSWSWNQPAIEGTAPTGRYSHAAIMAGNSMLVSFGLTAGGATNNIYILDTTSNTWQTSYAPANLSLTSTNPQDWPGYKPPPVQPTGPQTGPPTNPGTIPTTSPSEPKSNTPSVGSIVGAIVGVVALTAILFVVIRRHRRHQMTSHQAKMASFYGTDFMNQRGYQLQENEAAYGPTGMAFESPRSSFGQRMEELWASIAPGALRRGSASSSDQRASRRSQSRRLKDRDTDEESMRSLQMGPITDQDIFLDAVHRARSRVGRQSPVFAPLQQPIRPGSPTNGGEPQSPRSPKLTSVGIGSPLRHSGTLIVGTGQFGEGEDSTTHGRSYSDGFENSMLEMDVQMVAVPRGRLYVVNPSDEALVGQGHHAGQGEPQAPGSGT